MNKEPRISVRVPPELKARLAETAKLTGIDEATLVRNCIESIVDYIEENKEITFPLVVKPRSAEKDLPRRNVKGKTHKTLYPAHEKVLEVMEEKPNSPGSVAAQIANDTATRHGAPLRVSGGQNPPVDQPSPSASRKTKE